MQLLIHGFVLFKKQFMHTNQYVFAWNDDHRDFFNVIFCAAMEFLSQQISCPFFANNRSCWKEVSAMCTVDEDADGWWCYKISFASLQLFGLLFWIHTVYLLYIYIVLCFYLYNMSWFLWVFRPEHPIYCSSCKLTPQKAPLCNQRAYPQYRMYCIDFTFSHGGCNHSLAKGNRCRKLRMALPFVACEDMAFVNRKKGVSKPAEKDAVFIQGTRTRTVNSTKDHQENDQKFHSKNLWHYCSASQTMIASWPWNSKQYKNTSKQFLFCQILHVSDEKKPTWKRMIDGCRINGNAAIPIYIGWSMATGDGQAKWPLPSPAAQRRKRTHAARPGLVLCDVFNVACVVFFLVKLELGC